MEEHAVVEDRGVLVLASTVQVVRKAASETIFRRENVQRR